MNDQGSTVYGFSSHDWYVSDQLSTAALFLPLMGMEQNRKRLKAAKLLAAFCFLKKRSVHHDQR